jgi:hypothetical protein
MWPFHRVMLNGEPLTTSFVSKDELKATIPPEAIPKAGTYLVTLKCEGESFPESHRAHVVVGYRRPQEDKRVQPFHFVQSLAAVQGSRVQVNFHVSGILEASKGPNNDISRLRSQPSISSRLFLLTLLSAGRACQRHSQKGILGRRCHQGPQRLVFYFHR